MAYRSPPDVTQAAIQTGVVKGRISWDKALVAGFLAGACEDPPGADHQCPPNCDTAAGELP